MAVIETVLIYVAALANARLAVPSVIMGLSLLKGGTWFFGGAATGLRRPGPVLGWIRMRAWHGFYNF